ncbi:hypothetical protein [Fulvivirga ligni]|uniref:hypothetical protein n=1 Tax=Fulvivirga ligni TaxID=2904246 RepID=UPI001F2B4A03|nr:hypothetical protein [Fulvivirga ligni]UII19800.1 hypothetical protein LVD16_18320 [Fulvivirga ligni]
MKKTILFFIFCCFTFSGYSQSEEKMSEENVVRGAIVKNNEVIQGFIRKKGTTYLDEETFDAPWSYQNTISFIPKDVFNEKEKIKNKDFEKYNAKDIEGYVYYTSPDDSLVFESVKYSDMSAVGTGMIAKKIFMRKISDGKISLFYHYSAPLSMGEISAMKQSYIECKEPNLVYQTDEKIRLVELLNVEKELSGCPQVVERYKNNEYKGDSDQETDSGFNKFLNKTAYRTDVRLLVIEDYNKVCGE